MSDWDADWPDDADFADDPDDSDEGTETIVCNACGRDVYEEATVCPYCGEFLTVSTSAWSGRPVWWSVVGLVGIVAVILVLLRLVI
ncbi:hypothetical protein GC176_08235 [bacterium]|nr:hypothetical protein [bacterium]